MYLFLLVSSRGRAALTHHVQHGHQDLPPLDREETNSTRCATLVPTRSFAGPVALARRNTGQVARLAWDLDRLP